MVYGGWEDSVSNDYRKFTFFGPLPTGGWMSAKNEENNVTV
jgi:hypothetical protein